MMNDETLNVLKVRAFLLKETRKWFDDNGYIEVQAPILTPALGQLPNSFEVKYFDKKAYLSGGFLPYGLAFADKLKKVYTITPGFRKEQESKRHLTEYWRIESVQNCDLEHIMKEQEELISYISTSLSSDFKEMPKKLNRSPKDLAKIETPFDRLTYDEAINMLQKDGYRVFWGQEIDPDLEQHISLKFDKPFFIWKYPYCPETLFSKTYPKNPEVSLSADLLAPEGYGEIASSLQMLMQKESLLKLMKEEGISYKDRIWFNSFIQSCADPWSGFAIGLERLLLWICKLADIKETIAFPRTAGNIYP